MQKTLDDQDDLNKEEVANAETKIIEVGKGDNLMGVFLEAGTDKSLATAIVDSLVGNPAQWLRLDAAEQ